MDIIDTAAEIEELQRNAALSARRIDRNAVSAEHCAGCGEDIPAPRRAAVPGCQTCAECQGVIELRKSSEVRDVCTHSKRSDLR
jgi:phage/conjugal plasmid C-4 type zinc finger TraR family protein